MLESLITTKDFQPTFILMIYIVLLCESSEYDCPISINGHVETLMLKNYAFRKPIEIEFQPGIVGLRFIGNKITYVRAESQADKLGVRVEWKISVIGQTNCSENMTTDEVNKLWDIANETRKAYIVQFHYDDGVVWNISCLQINIVTKNVNLMSNSAITTFEFPVLNIIQGNLHVQSNNVMTNVELPVLRTVGADLIIGYNENLAIIMLPNLTDIGGDLKVYKNLALNSVEFSALASIGGGLTFLRNKMLTSFRSPVLIHIGGGILTEGHHKLKMSIFQKLTYIGAILRLRDNQALTNATFPNLTNIGSDLYIMRNYALVMVMFPNLSDIGGYLLFFKNHVLTLISFPQLIRLNKHNRQVPCDQDDSFNWHFAQIDICIALNPQLEKLEFQSLTSLKNNMAVLGNSNIQAILLCSLDQLMGSFGLTDSPYNVTIVVCGEIEWHKFNLPDRSDFIGCDSRENGDCFDTSMRTHNPSVIPRLGTKDSTTRKRTTREPSKREPSTKETTTIFGTYSIPVMIAIATSSSANHNRIVTPNVFQNKNNSYIWFTVLIIFLVLIAIYVGIYISFMTYQRNKSKRRETMGKNNTIIDSKTPPEPSLEPAEGKIWKNQYGQKICVEYDIPVLSPPNRVRRK